MHKAFRFRLYPTTEQQGLFHQTFGCVRFVFNHFLSRKKEIYATDKRTLTYTECSAQLTALKKEYPWLRQVDAIALQQALRALDLAFANFFKHEAGFPQFKSKRHHRHRYRTQCVNDNIRIRDDAIKLPKIGWVRYAKSRDVSGKIVAATITRNPSGKFFVSITCEVDKPAPLPPVAAMIGIDLGIRSFAVITGEGPVPNPRYWQQSERKLARRQKRLSRKQRGSRNREKARIRVARMHERIANQRLDFQHQLSTRLIRENQVISLEELRVRNMVKNPRLAQSISDAGWSGFSRMLAYKAEWYGRTVIRIDPWYPSSQVCSACGQVNKEVRSLGIRAWTCSACQVFHDRDGNAATNILREGLRQLQ